MKVTRREFIRQSAAAASAAVAGIPLPGFATNVVTEAELSRGLTADLNPALFGGR